MAVCNEVQFANISLKFSTLGIDNCIDWSDEQPENIRGVEVAFGRLVKLTEGKSAHPLNMSSPVCRVEILSIDTDVNLEQLLNARE